MKPVLHIVVILCQILLVSSETYSGSIETTVEMTWTGSEETSIQSAFTDSNSATSDDATYASVYSSLDDATYSSVYSSSDDATYSSVNSNLDDATYSSVYSSLDDATYSSVNSSLDDATYSSVNSSLDDATYSSVYSSLDDATYSSVYSSSDDQSPAAPSQATSAESSTTKESNSYSSSTVTDGDQTISSDSQSSTGTDSLNGRDTSTSLLPTFSALTPNSTTTLVLESYTPPVDGTGTALSSSDEFVNYSSTNPPPITSPPTTLPTTSHIPDVETPKSDIPDTKPIIEPDFLSYRVSLSMNLSDGMGRDWESILDSVKAEMTEVFTSNIAFFHNFEITKVESVEFVYNSEQTFTNHTVYYDLLFLYKSLRDQLNTSPVRISNQFQFHIEAIQTNEDLKDVIAVNLTTSIVNAFKALGVINLPGLTVTIDKEVEDRLQSAIDAMLDKTACDLIEDAKLSDTVCEACYAYNSSSCSDEFPLGYCKFNCSLARNQQCVVISTATTPATTECRCANEYLPVGSDCVHEDIIIGCSVAAACVVVIALVASVIYIVWFKNKNEKSVKYLELSGRTAYNDIMALTDKEGSRLSEISTEIIVRNELSTVEQHSNEQTDQNITTFKGPFFCEEDNPEDEDAVISRLHYRNLPSEITESDTFKSFSPRLDSVDTTKEYKLARARIDV